MKITKRQLKRIIREEVQQTDSSFQGYYSEGQNVESLIKDLVPAATKIDKETAEYATPPRRMPSQVVNELQDVVDYDRENFIVVPTHNHARDRQGYGGRQIVLVPKGSVGSHHSLPGVRYAVVTVYNNPGLYYMIELSKDE